MTHYSAVLAWVLLHVLWQATAIAFAYKLLDRQIATERPETRYNLALMALLCIFGVSVVTFFHEQLHIHSDPGGINIIASAARNSLLVNTAPVASLMALFHENSNGIIQLVDMTWLAGVLVLSVRALGGAWILSRYRTALSYAPADDLAQRFRSIAQRLDIRQRVTLRIHAAAINPFVIGAFRSVVYLPASAFTSLSPEQIDAILSHELAHVRRADCLWNLLQVAVETLFFFHPAVWWLSGVLREQREFCCDDVVLNTIAKPTTYATALLALAENRRTQPQLSMGIGGDPTMQLLPRIARILGTPLHSTRELQLGLALKLSVLVFVSIAVLCGSAAVPFSSITTSSRTQTIASSDPPQYNVPGQESQKASSQADMIADDIARHEPAIVTRRQAASTLASGFARNNAQTLSEQAAAAAVIERQGVSPKQDGGPDASVPSNRHPDVTPQNQAP
jgi:beta-lactamase regulating signal transducer with metallopeptidase domain